MGKGSNHYDNILTGKTIVHLKNVWIPLMRVSLQRLSQRSDILCFQETKTTRSNLPSEMAKVMGYEAFFSFNKKNKKIGYSGTATYVRSAYIPVMAKEGFSGLLETPKHIYPELHEEFDEQELMDLDTEGRVVMTDHQFFVLFNVYFPNDMTEERLNFKLRFYRAIELRVNQLIAQKRHVIIAGDVNVSHRPIDHCDPARSIKEYQLENFQIHPARQWLDGFLIPKGSMIDTFRYFHPTQEKAFTCWNTVINARETNFGTRIDYILCSGSMKSWLQDCSLRPEIMGSDHCPVEALLNNVHPETQQVLLDLIHIDSSEQRDLQNICANEWPEFSSQQSTIKGFLMPRSKMNSSPIDTQNTKPAKRKPQPTLDAFFKPSLSDKKLKSLQVSHPVEPLECITEEKKQTMKLWKALLKPPSIPKCLHGELCKEFTVNKPGPNKGKLFYLCARPVGPEQHEEKDGKKRKVLNEFRCDYFKWKK